MINLYSIKEVEQIRNARYSALVEQVALSPKPPYYPLGYTDNAGSREAAEIFESEADLHRGILRAWFKQNPKGSNPQLIAIELGMPDCALSFRSRCTELTDDGFLIKTDRRTELPSGVNGSVWELNACNLTLNEDN